MQTSVSLNGRNLSRRKLVRRKLSRGTLSSRKLRPLIAFTFLLSIAFGSEAVFAQGFRMEGGRPPSVRDGGTFVSLEGQFSIALPSQQNGFTPLELETPAGRGSGDGYSWEMKEGIFTAGYIVAARPLDHPNIIADVFGSIRKSTDQWASAKDGKLISDKESVFESHPALELIYEFPGGVYWQRFYLVSRRLYHVVLVVRTEQRAMEAEALKVLDSFKLLSDAEVAAALKAKFAAAEPSPLPQEPVATRAGSDAGDNRLHGRVKTVFRESEDLSGTWAVQGRKPSAMDYYNERGNLTRAEFYDYKGNLSDITVYGYIDGARVSSRKSIEHNYNPPPMMIGPAPGAAARPKPDPRYSNKFVFQYDEQKRLIEKTWFLSNGEVTVRDVYKYRGNPVNEVEGLGYSADGSLNRRYVSLRDEKGNEIERTDFDTKNGSIFTRSKYTYEFDSHGNWIKRTISEAKGGGWDYKPAYVDYRTITYY